jgi:hypothetical protein
MPKAVEIKLGREKGTADYWVDMVRRWQLSGLTIKEFCQKEGIGKMRLRVWYLRLFNKTEGIKEKMFVSQMYLDERGTF